MKHPVSLHYIVSLRILPDNFLLFSLPTQHFFTSFGARDRTYMMMFRLWQNALLEKVSTAQLLPSFGLRTHIHLECSLPWGAGRVERVLFL